MLTVLSIKNPVYTNAEGTNIDCVIQFAEFANNPLFANSPFHATADDPETHGQEIYADLKAGKYGPIAEYVPPVVVPKDNQPRTTGTTPA